jgi:adenylate cyclase
MFKTFRSKLLFWFLFLISSNLAIVGLTTHYLTNRERISRSIDLVESAYVLILKDVNTQQNFFGYETKNEQFFSTGKSTFLRQHIILSDSIRQMISLALSSSKAEAFGMEKNLIALKSQTTSIDSIFLQLVELTKIRGYKDFNLEGKMRLHAHWLENNKILDTENILRLRRHEKDYIIRNDTAYVHKFNALISDLNKKSFQSLQKDSILFHLNAYQQSFNAIVKLDQQIGIKANTGLKRKLDEKVETLETSFHTLVVDANLQEKALLRQLNINYASTAIVLVLLSILISYILSKKITLPLIELTNYITRFVESNFTTEESNLAIRSQDEIGKLTQNFTVMKDEVVNRLKFFKQKVEERTAELAEANQRLIKVNEANSRFVPKEFLQFLSKESIEEVMLGDQVEHEMTVMFTDIRSFTKISESLSPQENFDFINGY